METDRTTQAPASTAPGWMTGPMATPPEIAMRSGRAIRFDDVFAWRIVGAPWLSPDGTRVVAEVQSIDQRSDEYRAALWLFPLDGAPRQLTTGRYADTAPRWSPDGSQIAFLSTRVDAKAQLFLLPMIGGEPRQLTFGDDAISDFDWSPKGDRLLVTRKAGEKKPDGASDVKVITDVRYKFDGQGFLDPRPTHAFVISLEAGAEPVQVTEGAAPVHDPRWSPDGARIVFTANRHPDWQKSRISDVWTVNADGSGLTRLTDGCGQYRNARWSPDGQTIAATGHADVSLMEVSAWLYLIPVEGGRPTRLGAQLDRSLGDSTLSGPNGSSGETIVWTADGAAIDALVADRGTTVILRFPVDGSSPMLMGGTGRHVRGFAPMADGYVMAAADPTSLVELIHVHPDGERRLSHFNDAWLDEVFVAAPEEFWITVNGEEIQGWLLRPEGNHAGSTELAPLVLNIHGGPHGQFGSAFFHELQVYPANGFAVAFINPRGSTGRHNVFAQAINAHWGVADMPDFMAALDHVLGLGGLDPARIGVTGGSYGGFSTNWLLGHTDRFKAAVTDRSISNMISMYGTDDIALVSLDPELGTPWENVETYWNASPLQHVANFSAPLLIIHSEHDYRCPMEQAEQLYLAMHRLDKPVKFVRFPDESHGLSRNGKPKHRIERFEQTIGWFREHL